MNNTRLADNRFPWEKAVVPRPINVLDAIESVHKKGLTWFVPLRYTGHPIG